MTAARLHYAAVLDAVREDRDRLKAAIVAHHRQKPEDRSLEDDRRLYEAAGLPVGDPSETLKNCQQFLTRPNAEGGWPSYAELEAQRDALATELEMWKPLTPQRAEAALARAEAEPFSEERIQEILDAATNPAHRCPNDELAQLVAYNRRLEIAFGALANDPAYRQGALTELRCIVREARIASSLPMLDWLLNRLRDYGADE